MRDKRGSQKLPSSLLATTWDKENCCVIKTTKSTDSFVLIGSSEHIVKKTGYDGALSSMVICTPRQSEKGSVGVVLERELEGTFCTCCGSNVREHTILFISIVGDRNGRPKTHIEETFTVSVPGVKLTVSDGLFVDLIAPNGKFTTNFRKSHESNGEHVWYVPARKIFCFLVRPSLEFLLEAAKCTYFERLAVRRDDLLQKLMEDVFEEEDERIENYRMRLDTAERELATLEDEMTEMCCAQDREYDEHDAAEEKAASEIVRLRERIEELEMRPTYIDDFDTDEV